MRQHGRHFDLVLGLLEEFVVLLGFQRHDLERVLFAVGTAPDVQDGTMGAAAKRAQDLKIANRAVVHTGILAWHWANGRLLDGFGTAERLCSSSRFHRRLPAHGRTLPRWNGSPWLMVKICSLASTDAGRPCSRPAGSISS